MTNPTQFKEGDIVHLRVKVIFIDPQGDIEVAGEDWECGIQTMIVSPEQLRPLEGKRPGNEPKEKE